MVTTTTITACATPTSVTMGSLSLASVCTVDYVAAALPADGFYLGITVDPSSVTANIVTGASYSSNIYPNATIDYCNVTYSYSHNGRDDVVLNELWFPAPSDFQNRWLSTGGGGYAINSGDEILPGGVLYGAVSGITDGSFGGFDNDFDTTFPLVNGTANWDTLFMFGYQAHHELATLGKEITRLFYNVSSDEHIYSYYQGCSEGGREGWSQVQRYADQFDGVVVGAPAFRFSQQQVQHLYSGVVEYTLDYYPSNCELSAITNATIAACDPLDGKTDGVIGRSDLCKLKFNSSSLIGTPFSCPEYAGSSAFGEPASSSPAINGTISAEAITLVETIYKGLHDLKGNQAYFSYQPGTTFVDGYTTYDNTTDTWTAYPTTFGAEFVQRFINLLDSSELYSYGNMTYDSLVAWIWQGWQTYEDTMQTTWPDLTPYHSAGGKILHYHGESDFSIPTASSVRYYESVRSIMYPNLSFNESTAALNDWYRLFLVPGAGHCSVNTLQPNGPFPQTQLATVIDWVENGVEPTTLNGTILQGDLEGQQQQICSWPSRPVWSNNGTTMSCVFDQTSYDSWIYDFSEVFSIPVY